MTEQDLQKLSKTYRKILQCRSCLFFDKEMCDNCNDDINEDNPFFYRFNKDLEHTTLFQFVANYLRFTYDNISVNNFKNKMKSILLNKKNFLQNPKTNIK